MPTHQIREIYERGIYFLSDNDAFSYLAICLADGLNLLGVPIFANISYNNPLISDFRFRRREAPDALEKSYCVVIDVRNTDHYHYVVRLEPMHERTVVLCMQDNVNEFCIAGVAALFCAHGNCYKKMGGERVPVAFGLSSAIIKKTQHLVPNAKRYDSFIYSFRPTFNQHVRASLDLSFIPNFEKYLPVHRRLSMESRWSDDYYALLCRYTGCFAYGGAFEPDFSKSCFMREDSFRAFMSHVQWLRDPVIIRWDSWRFWESLACGCVTVHLDFVEYGFELPIMPENWKNYVGINFAHVQRDIERLMDERCRWPEIAWSLASVGN